MGSRWSKTSEKRGLKVQSPIFGRGVILGVKTQKKIKYFLLSYFFTISERKISMRVPMISIPLSSSLSVPAF